MPSPAILPISLAAMVFVMGVSWTREDVARFERRSWQTVEADVKSIPASIKGLSGEFVAAGLEVKYTVAAVAGFIEDEFNSLKQRIPARSIPEPQSSERQPNSSLRQYHAERAAAAGPANQLH